MKIWVDISFFVTDVVNFNYYLACNIFYINLFRRLLDKTEGFSGPSFCAIYLFVL